MKFCCDDIVKLGCFDSCKENIETGLTADVTGNWRAEAEFGGGVIRFEFSATENEKIILPNRFNEDYTHLIKFFRPDGSVYQNKCFTIKTYPLIG